KAWADADVPDGQAPRGDARPAELEPAAPPGVVVSSPDSPALAGAVALAAGRFQPLLRWETPKSAAGVLTDAEAHELAPGLETLVSAHVPRYDRLGDDCDFVTLAGDYPYRYQQGGSVNAFDDLILRTAGNDRRWGFAGRVMGDAVRSAYVAMCSLFLRPTSAL